LLLALFPDLPIENEGKAVLAAAALVAAKNWRLFMKVPSSFEELIKTWIPQDTSDMKYF
jgi:hypothetical protein